MSPDIGTSEGGTHLFLGGTGFATEFYSQSNTVYIGTDSAGWVQCDVIEGARQRLVEWSGRDVVVESRTITRARTYSHA